MNYSCPAPTTKGNNNLFNVIEVRARPKQQETLILLIDKDKASTPGIRLNDSMVESQRELLLGNNSEVASEGEW